MVTKTKISTTIPWLAALRTLLQACNPLGLTADLIRLVFLIMYLTMAAAKPISL